MMLHTLRLFGPQVRPDRDDYVTVHEENIEPEEAKRFMKFNNLFISTYGVPYDFNSLMHAIPEDSSKTRDHPRIVAKDPLNQPGMGMNFDSPSHSDYLLINRLFRCFDRCNQSEVNCENGGFLNPNDCTKCICPQGFTGVACNELVTPQKGCGGYEVSTTSWRRLRVRLNIKNTPCYWFLKAEEGQEIEIQLEEVQPKIPGCHIWPYRYLEVRLGNFVVGGYKFFCDAHVPNHTLISEGNLAVLTASKDTDYPFEFELLFRTVPTISGTIRSTFEVSLVLVLFSVLLL